LSNRDRRTLLDKMLSLLNILGVSELADDNYLGRLTTTILAG